MKKLSDKSAMALAIKEAQKGIGFVSPNPPVGCVILNKNREFLSSGFYSHYGAIHAEMMALNKIKDKKQLEKAHLFVTLEPCFHFGQNPPCVDHLIKYSWASLTYGVADPNPKTNKKSIKKLKSKGFKLKKSIYFKESLHRLYEAFALNMKKNQTFFALKIASSLDGVVAFNHGESQWITGLKARNLAHQLRSGFSAILIGVNTFLQDNPRLNCRIKSKKSIQNKVIILDPFGYSFSLIERSHLARVRSIKDIYIVSQKKPKKPHKFQHIYSKKSPFDLKALGKTLYNNNIPSVLVEGGADTLTQFLKQKIASRLYYFINPCLLGGEKALFWTEKLNIENLKSKKYLKSLEILDNGEDIFITGLIF
ncbi:MAG: bifunctional diaminohydroxyphosphoribosylaminopyrimidine deaminase/5-amino-6-(5-phosphoribosylamino)uracil reductase RibD [Bdellovibrionaceae bacterium]|nr:bifunctional diaminohydroxyphosphoribosylaminopyrimidine deaminase/5-amino-6-(5-phosphoribosylamino)uracil reductase RibD [Pseudobdellovibrionaceae bacterium]